MRIYAHEVIRYVAGLYDIGLADMSSGCRRRQYARPRQIAMHCIRRLCPHMSYPAIGRAMGGRDHTTVLHGDRKIAALLETEEDIALAVDAVMLRFTAPVRSVEVNTEFAALCMAFSHAMRPAA